MKYVIIVAMMSLGLVFPRVVMSQGEQPADTEELEDRLSAVEDEIAQLAEDQYSLEQQLEDAIDLTLYVTLEYENFRQTDSAFDARNVELLVNANLGSWIRAGAEIEFERTAKTSGSSNRTGEVEVEQGWLEFVISEALRPRFGVVLVPFGRFNTEHFDSTRDLTDRPVMMRRVIPVTWSEAGIGFTGHKHINKSSVGFDYTVYLINGLTNDLTDTSPRNARGGFGKDNNNNKAFVGRLNANFTTDLQFAVSGYRGKLDSDGENAITGLGADLRYSRKGIEFLGEFARFDLDDGFQADGLTTTPDAYSGYFLQTNYHFWPKFLNDTFMGSRFSSPTMTASLRYGSASIGDDGDIGTGDNEEERWTIGVNYRPSESVVFKMEYQFNDTVNEPLERGNSDGFIMSISGAF